MITKELLRERHDKRLNEYLDGNSNYRSQPQPLYFYGILNSHNWNGGDAVIRQFTKWLEYQDRHRFAKEFDYLNYCYEMVCNWDYFEDVNYTTIILRKYNYDVVEIEYYKEVKLTYDTYLIAYYKDRGKTDVVQLNGKTLDVNEYVHFLNIIEASGYKFEL